MNTSTLGDIPHIPPELLTMSNNHPARSNAAARTPEPHTVSLARTAAKLTPDQAGAHVYESGRRWLQFESGEARMHPAAWALFQLRTAAAVEDTLDGLAQAVYYADSYNEDADRRTVRVVLDIALRTRLGIACLGGRRVSVDLGNGHFLDCTTRPKA